MRRAVWIGAGLYLLLLVASALLGPALAERVREAGLGEPGATRFSAAPGAELGGRTWGGAAERCVLILPGDAGARALTPLASTLANSLPQGRFVALPDLPGFGLSPPTPAPASLEADAEAVAHAVLPSCAQWDVVGHGRGGGVALALAETEAERIRSLVLISAPGVQELALLGSYELNHLVHGLQLALLRASEWAVPDFGSFARMRFNARFARAAWDSDLRPNRARLAALTVPVLIVHGRSDARVPSAAAREHARIVPQAELALLDGGHGLVRQQGAQVAARIDDFLRRVTVGRAASRDDATAERVASSQAAPPADARGGPRGALGWLLFVALVFAASMVSEDLTCIGVGLLVARGAVGLAGGSLAAGFALVVGDLLLYATGRGFGGLRLAARLRARARATWAGRRDLGAAAILASRFVPGTRLPTYVAAGAVHYPALRFSVLLAAAAAVWTPIVVGATAAGTLALDGLPMLRERALLAAGLAIALVLAVQRLALPALRYRGRRLLLARWRRWLRWEFWPIWAIYAAIVPFVAGLALRHRGLRLPLLANPGIALGGLAGESKAEILGALDPPAELGLALAVLPDGWTQHERLERAAAFAAEHGFPIVVKPDVGERGFDVAIARDRTAFEREVAQREGRVLLQEYAPGDEYGIYYVRMPGEPHGRVLSIAEKRMPVLEGDGVRDIEGLILEDPRTLPNAKRLLAANAPRLGEVPAAGERVAVVELGTHSRGCQFLDANALWSEALEARFDELSRGFDGFFLGRFDVRTLDVEAFAAGGAFKVIELNGLTSEPAHMYDPRYGFWDAQRVLRDHWRRAFEIGAAVRAGGTHVPGWAELLAGIRAHRSSVR
jgi:pimeloyl-ACP methyl ester carboxylesterase/membrane protein DedA with SNARE-associated domain